MVDEIDLGEGFGLMSLEDIKKGMMLERDYRKKTSELARDKESFYAQAEELQNKAAAVDLINQYELGETVLDMINNAASGQPYGNPQAPQYGQGGAMPDYPDTHFQQLQAEIAELKRRDEERERMFWDTRVQQEISAFRSSHSDVDDEKMADIGQYMVDNNLPTLEAAYRLWGFDDMMQSARLDGESRIREQLGVRGEGQTPSSPVLSGGTGDLSPDEGQTPPSDWKSAREAAIKEAQEKGLF